MFWILLWGSWSAAPWGHPLERLRSARGIAVALRADWGTEISVPTPLSAEMRALPVAKAWTWRQWKIDLAQEPSWKSQSLSTGSWSLELAPAGGHENWVASLPEILSAKLTWALSLSTAAFVLIARLLRVWLWGIFWFAGLRLLKGFGRLELLMQALAWTEVWALFQSGSGWVDWTFAIVPLMVGICARAISHADRTARWGWIVLAGVIPWVRPEYAIGIWMALPSLLEERRGWLDASLGLMAFGAGAYFQWPIAQVALLREMTTNPVWTGWVAKGMCVLACIRPFGARDLDFSARALLAVILGAGSWALGAGLSGGSSITELFSHGLSRPVTLAGALAWPLVLPLPRWIWWLVGTGVLIGVAVSLRSAAG